MMTVKRVNPVSRKRVEGHAKAESAAGRPLVKFPEGFSFVSNVAFQSIASGELSGEALRVFAFMALHCKRSNRFEGTQRWMAASLGMLEQNVSRAVRELVKLRFVIRVTEPNGERHLYLDARRQWRGSAESHQAGLDKQARQRERDARANVRALRSQADAA